MFDRKKFAKGESFFYLSIIPAQIYTIFGTPKTYFAQKAPPEGFKTDLG